MNVEQATKLLSEEGITSSEQIVRRWIRQGKIKATLQNKKEGYQIDEKALREFIKLQKKVDLKTVEKIQEDAKERHAEEAYQAFKNFEKTLIKNRELEEKIRELGKKLHQTETALLLEQIKNSSQFNGTASNIKNLFGTEQETKRIFRKITSSLHPDNGGNEETFKKVNEVYQKEFRSGN